jgi:hypothetical protein
MGGEVPRLFHKDRGLQNGGKYGSDTTVSTR